MSNKFSRLFRQSKIATFDPKIEQVYTTYPASKAIGDWGMKHTLPKAVRTNYISLQKLDSFERIPVFKSAKVKVQAMLCANENFKQSASPIRDERYSYNRANPGLSFLKMQTGVDPFPEASLSKAPVAKYKKSIEELNPEEFKELLKEARARRDEFKTKVKEKKISPMEYQEFMNLRTTLTDTGVENVSLVEPQYHNYIPSSIEDNSVEGRILAGGTDSFIVGIQGTLAVLPKSKHSENSDQPHRGVANFYITKTKYLKDGTPQVEVSMYHEQGPQAPERRKRQDYAYYSAMPKNLPNLNRPINRTIDVNISRVIK